MLFGSRASGVATAESDWDLLLVGRGKSFHTDELDRADLVALRKSVTLQRAARRYLPPFPSARSETGSTIYLRRTLRRDSLAAETDAKVVEPEAVFADAAVAGVIIASSTDNRLRDMMTIGSASGYAAAPPMNYFIERLAHA